MHRTFTFSDDLNVSTDDENAGNKISKREILSKFAIGLIEFLTSSTFYCFGVLFCELLSQEYYRYDEGLWTTILFIFSWNIAGPFSRRMTHYLESNGRFFFRCSVTIATIFLFVGLMMPHDITFYGIFGGICTNFISVQIRYVSLEKFSTNINVFEGHRQIARAASLFIMPHFMLLLASNYELFRAKVIFATFLLNIIPITLLINYKKTETTCPVISRYHTLPTRFSSQNTELKVFSAPYGVQHPDSDDLSISSQSSNEEEGEYQANEANHEFFEIAAEHNFNLNPVKNYYRSAGVSILPEIPEEEEEEEDINVINPKRLSRISVKLRELNRKEKAVIRDEEDVVQVLDINELMKVEQKPEKIDNIEYIHDFSERDSTFIRELKSFNKIRSCCCSAYSRYLWSRRFRSVRYFFKENFLNPLLTSLRTFHFYPALLSRLSNTLTSALYITLAPFLAVEENREQSLPFTTGDATFLLTYIAFSWSFFLVTLPLLFNLSQKRIKVIYILGFFVTSASLSLLVRPLTNDNLTISCLFFGFGHGILGYTEPIVLRNDIGARPWKSVQSTLDVFVAVISFSIYYVVYANEIKLATIILYAFEFNFSLWILLSVCYYCVACFKKCSCLRRKRQNIVSE